MSTRCPLTQEWTSGPEEVARPNDLICIAIGSSGPSAKTVHNGGSRAQRVTRTDSVA
jgi:hypothetical protein